MVVRQHSGPRDEAPSARSHPDAGSEATRYLCAAAHTDDAFTERVLAEVFDDDLRAVAPSVGFDLGTVLRHCLSARRRRRLRDVGLLVVGGLAVLLAPLATVLVGVTMAVGSSLAPLRPGRNGPVGPFLSMIAIATVSLVLVFQLGAATPGDDPAGLPGWVVGRPWLALPAGLVAYLVLVGHLLGTRRLLVTRLRRARFRPGPPDVASLPARDAERLAAVDRAQGGNVTVYGGYTPFVGHGTPVAGWSFALPILADAHGPVGSVPTGDVSAPAPFTVVELIDHVRARLAAVRLGQAGDPTPERLAGLLLEDRVFVCGDRLTGDARLLPHRERMPRQRWSDDEVREVAGRPQGAARHYLCALVPSWGGEVVASTFLHFSTDGQVLYLECARTVLEPPRQGYHDVDRLTEWLPVSQLAQVLATGTERLLPTALGAPLRLLRDLVRGAARGRRQARLRQLAREDLGYDYGAQVGVREVASGAEYHNYFQVLDAAKHLKVVERHVLAAIMDFLDARGVDTAEFRNRQTTILNQGVIQTGGLSVVGNQAVGQGARAEQQTEGAPPRSRRPRDD
ncbi:hypothetical protein OG989_22525 [Micromonospora sp. NBC_01740]|uniref:hypothetical protein n=1 Tax=Micromonospora sp. NBC_01740 TaxID=2975986 RepID=UPI002E1569F5|nr:hypothetical protein OG989_22525 [Micromonospora sp. NBC_01740]